VRGGDKINDRRTYGAAMEVPEMVLTASEVPIQAEVTSTPRNQTGKISGRAAVWCSERRRTIEYRAKVGEGSLGPTRINCSWSAYIGIVKRRRSWEFCAPTVFAVATRAGDWVAAFTLSLPAAEKND
jgi:hypothetical protein